MNLRKLPVDSKIARKVTRPRCVKCNTRFLPKRTGVTYCEECAWEAGITNLREVPEPLFTIPEFSQDELDRQRAENALEAQAARERANAAIDAARENARQVEAFHTWLSAVRDSPDHPARYGPETPMWEAFQAGIACALSLLPNP